MLGGSSPACHRVYFPSALTEISRGPFVYLVIVCLPTPPWNVSSGWAGTSSTPSLLEGHPTLAQSRDVKMLAMVIITGRMPELSLFIQSHKFLALSFLHRLLCQVCGAGKILEKKIALMTLLHWPCLPAVVILILRATGAH